MTARRAFMVALSAFAAAHVARAQPRDARALVVLVLPGTPEISESLVGAFRDGMRDAGQVDGQSWRYEARYAGGDTARLEALTRAAVAERPAVIVVVGLIGARIARAATTTIPVVVATSSDLAEAGLVKSLAKPGGNITGVSDLTAEATVKRLELVRATLPRARHVALLVNPQFPGTPAVVERVSAAAPALGIAIERADFEDRASLRARIDGLARRRPDAILVAGDSVATTWRADAIERANAARIAIVYYWPGTAEAGALFSYQADVRDNYRRAAGYVDRILKGTAPGDLPVYQPDRYELVVNARVARELGVDLPKSFLLRADRVIQ